MKLALSIAVLGLTMISGNVKAQVAGGYYMNQAHVQTSYSFISYSYQPAMCVYQRAVPQWEQVCGIQASQVSGCSYYGGMGGYAYQCGSQYVQQTVCAYRLNFYTYNVTAPCGQY